MRQNNNPSNAHIPRRGIERHTSLAAQLILIANVPLHDKFQVVARHAADEIVYPKEGYLGLNYTSDLIRLHFSTISRAGRRKGARSAQVPPSSNAGPARTSAIVQPSSTPCNAAMEVPS